MVQTICILLVSGFLYGLSALIAQKVFFYSKKIQYIPIFAALRLSVLGIFFYIILKSTQIHPIILIASFFIAYWLTILHFKEFINARS